MLSEEQISQLRPRWNDYPERRVVIPSYPPTRKQRGVKLPPGAQQEQDELGALPAGGLTGLPSVRLWSVSIFSNAVGVSIQRSSPSFSGPALIHSFTGVIRAHDPGSAVKPAQIAYSQTPYTDTDVGASNAKLPGSHITFNADPYANSARTAVHTDGFIYSTTTDLAFYPLGLYVDLERFYIGLLIEGTAAGQAAIGGMFRIIEDAPPESISWL